MRPHVMRPHPSLQKHHQRAWLIHVARPSADRLAPLRASRLGRTKGVRCRLVLGRSLCPPNPRSALVRPDTTPFLADTATRSSPFTIAGTWVTGGPCTGLSPLDRQTSGLPRGSLSPQQEWTDFGLGLAPPTRWLRSANGGAGDGGLGQPGRETGGDAATLARVPRGNPGTRAPGPTHQGAPHQQAAEQEEGGLRGAHRCLRPRGSAASRLLDATPLQGRGGEGGFGRRGRQNSGTRSRSRVAGS